MNTNIIGETKIKIQRETRTYKLYITSNFRNPHCASVLLFLLQTFNFKTIIGYVHIIYDILLYLYVGNTCYILHVNLMNFQLWF